MMKEVGTMSMVQLTILQYLAAFFIYTGLTVVLPAMVIYPKVAHCRAVTRFFVYFTLGNFYLMNLVYVLELLHISCWFTLVLGTVAPVIVTYIKIRSIPARRHFLVSNEQINRVIRGSFGIKNWLRRIIKRIAAAIWYGIRFACRSLRKHFGDCIMVAVVLAVVWYAYGWSLTENFGYCASDLPVHTYWINDLGKNQIFAGGVYPFGFHNIVYYIHTVFRIDTYALLRVFWLVQTIWIHLVLMMFLKGVCRSRFLPYAGTILFALVDFNFYSYERYFSSLPQEFGMLFILPAVYFAFAFFRIKKEELKGKRSHPVSKWYLVGFALNFAMTFSVHFYGTIILGFFCVGIACGYVWRFLQPKYFIKVVKTCFLGLMVALLPMVIAYLTGTQLEGSLRWAMSVMAPQEEETPQEEKQYDENGVPIGARIVELEDGILAYEDVLDDGTTVYYPLQNQDFSDEEREQMVEEGYIAQTDQQDETPVEQTLTFEERLVAFSERVVSASQSAFKSVDHAVQICQFTEASRPVRYLIYLCMMALPVIVLLLFVLRRFDEACSLVSVHVSVLVLMVMLAAGELGLPTIMQQSRICIYLNYSLPILWIMTADRMVYVLFGVWRPKWMRHLMNVASFAVAVTACLLMVQMGVMKNVYHELHPFQTNEAVTCLTNIIHDEEDFSWTIVSAYDEMRMGEDHGYHEELITFLQNMEYTGGTSMVTLPSKNVFFFIEKRPIDYSVPYEESGQMVSALGAMHELPEGSGFSNYMGENRWILMSRFYEWAKLFQRMHPNEMTVYFENENFICYKLVQNDYHLFNLAIDYGYNMR